MTSFHDQFLKSIEDSRIKMGAAASHLLLPPPSMLTLKHEYIAYTPGHSLTAKVPFNPDFRNPVGYYQGGFLAAALDDVFGPLSYVTAENPCVTLDLNVKFIRPFVAEQKTVVIEAMIISKTKSIITMEAKVRNDEGKIMATASMTSMILK